jgi:hypothetical protein
VESDLQILFASMATDATKNKLYNLCQKKYRGTPVCQRLYMFICTVSCKNKNCILQKKRISKTSSVCMYVCIHIMYSNRGYRYH